jgi:molybdate transport system regulatory protein
MELASKLTLEMLGEPFLLEKRIELLHAIEENGSISKAAKAVPMSYKSAWEAVDVMNTLSPEPIVYRETGGKDGGGTTVTAYGRTLLENYAVLKREHTRFIERLSELTDIQSGTFKTIGRLGMQLSARNQMSAIVLKVEAGEVNTKVYIKLKSGQRLLSIITEEAVENLHIEEGQMVIAICKSSSVSLSLPRGKQQAIENSLQGIVSHIDRDEENVKVTVDIGDHDKIISVLSVEVFKKTGITIEKPVFVEIKASDIMLGK